jgi:hypothetical protein
LEEYKRSWGIVYSRCPSQQFATTFGEPGEPSHFHLMSSQLQLSSFCLLLTPLKFCKPIIELIANEVVLREEHILAAKYSRNFVEERSENFVMLERTSIPRRPTCYSMFTTLFFTEEHIFNVTKHCDSNIITTPTLNTPRRTIILASTSQIYPINR